MCCLIIRWYDHDDIIIWVFSLKTYEKEKKTVIKTTSKHTMQIANKCF